MLIGIDGNEANVSRRVGISEYAFELLTAFAKKKMTHHFRIYLKEKPGADFPKESENWRYSIFGPRKFWTQLALPLKLFTEKEKPDVFFTPSHYAPRFSPIPTVVSLMDTSYLRFPELFRTKDLYQLRNWTKYSVKQASRIFTISRSSKDDIIQAYNLPSEKVIVTYLGLKEKRLDGEGKTAMNTLRQANQFSGKKYILFVGTIQPRKNIERLIEAFTSIAKEKDIDLVIAGKPGWLYENILEAPKKLGIEDRVHFLSFVSDVELAGLYKEAECFVLPSLYEGFGLPVLEAMKYGCPVIISNVSSLPEVGGDAALYVDPESTQDIREKILQLLDDQKLRKTLVEKGEKQVKKFSWEKTADETLKVLEEVSGK